MAMRSSCVTIVAKIHSKMTDVYDQGTRAILGNRFSKNTVLCVFMRLEVISVATLRSDFCKFLLLTAKLTEIDLVQPTNRLISSYYKWQYASLYF